MFFSWSIAQCADTRLLWHACQQNAPVYSYLAICTRNLGLAAHASKLKSKDSRDVWQNGSWFAFDEYMQFAAMTRSIASRCFHAVCKPKPHVATLQARRAVGWYVAQGSGTYVYL